MRKMISGEKIQGDKIIHTQIVEDYCSICLENHISQR